MRPIADWADRMYHERGHIAHIVPYGQPYSLCGGYPLGLRGWFGTGCMDEIEKAASLPLCLQCEASSRE